MISSIILLLLFFTTDPRQLPSVVLVAPFVLLFIIIAAGIPSVLNYYSFPRRSAVKVGAIAGLVPVILLVLQSLGQLTIRDVLTVVMLFGVVYFYTTRFGMRFTN